MKKSLIKFGSLLLLGIGLTACGNNNVADVDLEAVEPIRFKLEQTTWRVTLPSHWQLNQEGIPGTVLVAQHQDENFIIAQKPIYQNDIEAQVLDQIEETFFHYEFIAKNQDQLVFRGKRTVNDPLRVFYEKILPVPGTDSYLIGVCSYNYWEERPQTCSQILSTWQTEQPSE